MSSVHIKKIVDEPGIVKSAEDKRLYRALELTNGMRVVLISDPQTDKSSAAMDVYIGNVCLLWYYFKSYIPSILYMGHWRTL